MRIPRIFGMVLPVSLLLILPALGQSQEPRKEPEAKPAAPARRPAPPRPPKELFKKIEPEKRGPERKEPSAESADHEKMVDRRIAGILRLQSAVKDKIKLGEEERKKVDRLVDDYLAGLMGPDPGPHAPPTGEDVMSSQELPRLYKEMDAAKEAGDKETVAAIQEKINAVEAVLQPSVFDPPVYFVNALASELGKEHREDFDKVFKYWSALEPREISTGDNDLRRLFRSIRDPDLDLSDAERREILEMIMKAMRAMSIGERNNAMRAAEVAAEVRPKVFEKLKTEQREQVKKTIAMLEKWNAEDEKAVAVIRARLGRGSAEGDLCRARNKKLMRSP